MMGSVDHSELLKWGEISFTAQDRKGKIITVQDIITVQIYYCSGYN